MNKNRIETVKEQIFWAYANLAMAHTAIENKQDNYKVYNYKIRSKLFKGLISGNMNIRSFWDDEKLKFKTGNICSYCGSIDNLTLDHVFPKKYGGEDTGENLLVACKSCNSSKGKKDLMEWMVYRKKFLPLMIIRRYLKLTYKYCLNNGLLNKKISEVKEMELPFKIEFLPIKYPKPSKLILYYD